MRPITLLALLPLVAACSSGGSTAPAPVLVPASADVREAPAVASVATRTLRLEAFAWRDFMPGPELPRDGRPLIVSVRLLAQDGGALPAGIVPETVWVVRGERAWQAAAAEVRPAPDARATEVVVRDGPKWGPDEVVDVVLVLRDATGARVRLRAAGVRIVRTS